MSALSGWIKERRDELKLTQVQVASRLGVHQAQVSSLENGKLMPDATMMTKIEAVFGKFAGAYIPVQSAPGTKKIMSSKAKKGLKAYREAKENNFCLKIDSNVFISADRNQYILKQGANTSYFVELKALIKYLVASKMRQSAVNTVQDVSDRLDEIYKSIEEKFDEYDPANIAEIAEMDMNDEEDEETLTEDKE